MAVRCEVCLKEDSKYKCPSCHLQYCSIDCYKEHKVIHGEVNGNPPAINPLPAKPPPTIQAQPAANGVHKPAQGTFQAFSSSQELPQLFKRYPKLRHQLESIYNATLEPPPDGWGGYNRHDHSRGRGKGRGRGRGGSGPPWTQERGFKNGLHHWKRSRDREDGEAGALKEFSTLALKLSGYEAKDAAPADAQA